MTPPHTASPPREPTQLLTLPDEVLSLIILHLDKPTGLDLALVCQRLCPLADSVIWRDIKLLVPDEDTDGDENIATDEAAITEAEGHVSPAETRAAEAETGYRYRVYDLLALITLRRASMVRSLTVVPLPEALDGIITLLRLVAPVLESLTLEAPTSQHHQAGDPKDTLDVKLHLADLTFPSLRFLSLGPRVSRYHAFGPYLASLAPHLDTLEYHAEIECTPGVDNDNATSGPPYPPREPHASVTTFYLSSGSPESPDYFNVVPRLITHLISFPNVTRVILDHHIHVPETWTNPGHNPRDFKDIIEALGSLPDLEALAWNVDPNQFYRYMNGEDEGFRSLRRLALKYRTSSVQEIPALPNLEAVYYSFESGRLALPPVPFSRTTIHRPSIIPSSLNLRDSPNLATIHHLPLNIGKAGLGLFDRLDEIDIDNANGQVNSYTHNGEEVLQTYLLNYDLNGWEHRTEFRGQIVPLWVFEEMRVVEGKSEEEWMGRGIDVGKKAWGVLERWYAKE